LHHAKEEYKEFHRAWQLLFPDTRIENLRALARSDRIACLCMLSHAIYENELADFFIANVNKWQRRSITLDACKKDMIPHFTLPPQVVRTNVSAIQRLSKAKSDFDNAQDPKRAELQHSLRNAERRDASARRTWMQHAVPRKVLADRKRLADDRDKVKAAIDAAGGKASVDLEAALIMANAAHDRAAEAISRAEDDAETARQSIPKKYRTLEKAEAVCRPALARELQPGPSAAAASASPTP
jgi:hypothetical protein